MTVELDDVSFAVVRRGHDRARVDENVGRLGEQLDSARAARDAALEQAHAPGRAEPAAGPRRGAVDGPEHGRRDARTAPADGAARPGPGRRPARPTPAARIHRSGPPAVRVVSSR